MQIPLFECNDTNEQSAHLIKSISYDQQEILKDIIKLYIPSGHIDCDCTYSKGIFYKNSDICEPTYKFDINPINDSVVKSDCRNLPLEDNSIMSMVYDPPFLATRGKSLNKSDGNNLIANRFSVFPNEPELHKFYSDSLQEMYRVLDKDGILIVKCQDKVSSTKQYMSHCYIYNEAVNLGFYPIDLFILLTKSRLVADWQRNQKHSRKFHSYFWVFKKCDIKVKYR